jgi:hypothetical protein
MTLEFQAWPVLATVACVLFIGADGSGSSAEPFTSASGRVKLDPDNYFRGFYHPLPVGFELKWDALRLFTDTYKVGSSHDPSMEYATTLAQGLPNQRHVLELIADQGIPPPIKAFRIYNPPYLQTGQ